jgi:uncharacterized membrane protein HdeD (DUF308 family)
MAYDILDIQYSRKIIPQVGYLCGVIFTVSGITGLFTGLKYDKFKNNNYYIVFSIGSLISGLYLIRYFNEYNKQI